MIEDYERYEIIGTGAFCDVHRGKHKPSGKDVAIKVFSAEEIRSCSYRQKLFDSELETLQLLREGKKTHPGKAHLVEVFSYEESPEEVYIVMELIQGSGLDMIIENGEKISEESARLYFWQLVKAVDYCHCNNVCHRDLKPENIIIDEDKKHLTVLDLGLATPTTEEKRRLSYCGTEHYIAPEVLSGKETIDVQIDVWALGVILYYMLCGEHPFDDANTFRLISKIMSGKFSIPENISNDAKDLLLGMLNSEPEKRFNLSEILEHSWLEPVRSKNNNNNNNNEKEEEQEQEFKDITKNQDYNKKDIKELSSSPSKTCEQNEPKTTVNGHLNKQPKENGNSMHDSFNSKPDNSTNGDQTVVNGILTYSNGAKIAWERHHAEPSFGTIVIVHGFGEHMLLWKHVAEKFTQASYDVLLFDQQGYGQSKGDEYISQSRQERILQLDYILRSLVRLPNNRVFLYGHSSGGTIALQYGIELSRREPNSTAEEQIFPISGVIASAPLLRLLVDIPSWRRRASQAFKSSSFFREMDPRMRTKDIKMRKIYEETTIALPEITVQELISFDDLARDLLKNAHELQVPVFVLHGSGDIVTDYKASEKLVNEVGSSEKSFMLVWGSYHDLHMEHDRKRTFNRILHWCNKHRG